MKRTREWWARLDKYERAELVYLEKAEYHGGGRGGYYPDDCSECGGCSQPTTGVGFCTSCGSRVTALRRKADGEKL